MVDDANGWWAKRRPELLAQFAREIYGCAPTFRWNPIDSIVSSIDRRALGGLATRKEVTIRFAPDQGGCSIHLLLYVPNARKNPGPPPVFLGLNFYGNHTVHRDPGITLSSAWIPAEAPAVVNGRATEATRGSDASKWAVEAILGRGYAIATAYCGDLCPDHPGGLREAMGGWFDRPGSRGTSGAIAIWAWGLSRVLDYLETGKEVDASRTALHGHSRLGKTALWAAAQDQRFQLVISNNSGRCGASLSKRRRGETVADINRVFPHWFCANFHRYSHNEAALPIDQHELLALIAPRALYVTSAEDDDGADPVGEFLATKAAEPVYRLLGLEGLGATDMPKVDHPIGHMLRYHVRTGRHDLTPYDWKQFLDFADRWLIPSGPVL